jgi:hypothetical protein
VINRSGDVIASAFTNLDLHDISRAARTFGLRSFYVVTPLEDQIKLIQRLIDHWIRGAGATYNPVRKQALELIRLKKSLKEVIEDIRSNSTSGDAPKTVATSARKLPHAISFDELNRYLHNDMECLLILGTAWGLADDLISGADYILEPIKGISDYNHLSVRSAAAIMLDRLLGQNNNK